MTFALIVIHKWMHPKIPFKDWYNCSKMLFFTSHRCKSETNNNSLLCIQATRLVEENLYSFLVSAPDTFISVGLKVTAPYRADVFKSSDQQYKLFWKLTIWWKSSVELVTWFAAHMFIWHHVVNMRTTIQRAGNSLDVHCIHHFKRTSSISCKCWWEGWTVFGRCGLLHEVLI